MTINTATSYDPYKDFAVRITYTSKYSQKPEVDRTKIEYYIVRLTPSGTCIWNTMAKTAEMSNWPYIVSNANTGLSRTPSFTRTVASCKVYQKLYFLNEATQTWVDYAANTALYPFATFADGLNTADTNIGQLTVQATRALVIPSVSSWKPTKTYKVKITLEDLDSNHL